jgi:serine/threonine-protein kinase
MTLAGRVLAGRYRLERPLAEGGMGEVWVAHHETLDIPVAVKVMATAALAREGLRARFEREAKATAQLRTPHVVQVFDYGVDDETPFLVMELLDGEDFGALGRERAPFSLAETADLIGQAARGLQAAHQAGIIHRDIKPSNLFLARVARGQSLVKVLDFGIAKTFVDGGPKFTKTNVVLGSPSYMSPEQVLARPVDARTDIWSLGVVTFLMLSGELPFKGATALDVGDKIVKGARPRFTDVAAGMPAALDAMFDRALATAPTGRHATVADFADELARIAKEHPEAIVESKPATPPTPLAARGMAHDPTDLPATRDELARPAAPASSMAEESTERAPARSVPARLAPTMLSARPAGHAVPDAAAVAPNGPAAAKAFLGPMRTTLPLQDTGAPLARQKGNTAPMRGSPQPNRAWFHAAQTPSAPERTLEPTAMRKPESSSSTRSAPAIVSAIAIVIGAVALTALAARRWVIEERAAATSAPAATASASLPAETPAADVASAEPTVVPTAPEASAQPVASASASAAPPASVAAPTGSTPWRAPGTAPGTPVATGAAAPTSSSSPSARRPAPLPLGL